MNRTWLVCLIGLPLLASVSLAGTVYDATAGASAGSQLINNPGVYPSIYSSFTAPANFAITDVALVLDNNMNIVSNIPEQDTSGTLSLSVYVADGSTVGPGTLSNNPLPLPGTLVGSNVGSIANSQIPSTLISSAFSLVDVQLTTPLVLTAGGEYWLQVSDTSSNIYIQYTADLSGPGVGAEWNYIGGQSPLENTNGAPDYNDAFAADIYSPEPGTFVLGLLGIGSLVALKFRRG